MSYYANPTENAAIGNVDRELRIMRRRAEQIRRRRKQGLLTDAEVEQARTQFVGIYRGLLRSALED